MRHPLKSFLPAALTPALLLALAGLAAPAAALDLPILRPGRDPIAGACWRADRFEVELASGASRRAALARSLGLVRPGLSGVAAVDQLAATLGGSIEPVFRGESPPAEGSGETDFTAFHAVTIPEAVALEDAIARFAALPEVRAAGPIGIAPVSGALSDSMWAHCYWLEQPSGRHLHALEAWNITRGDSGAVIAILDTGVIPYHPDLGGTIAGARGNLFVNRVEENGVPGVDDDGNGFVDDVSGYDFVNLPTASGVTPGEDWQDWDNDPNDFAGHGTMVAGIAGAIADNGIGIPGIAPGARLLPVRIGWSANVSPLGLVDMEFVAVGIRYATRMGAAVINCSFSSLNTGTLMAAVSAATRAGVTVVVSAGNNGQEHYLGDRPDVTSVAAVTRDDVVYSGSNRGAYVDLSAPGVLMATTSLTRPGVDSLGRRQPAYIGPPSVLNGTSFSAPLTAGTVALMQTLRRDQGLRPLHPMGVQLRLRETSDDITALNTGVGYGAGRLNTLRALTDRTMSQAWGAGARTLGAAVVLPRAGGGTALAWATSEPGVLIVDGAHGDTLVRVPLPATAAPRSIAAGDVGGMPVGPTLFVALMNGRVAAFDATGAARPGWPVAGGALPMQGGPALGDLDGDGVPEIVCADDAGNVHAWRGDGTVVPGFPFASGNANGFGVPVAVADLDGLPGAEIAAIARDGEVHVVGGDGAERPGWPQLIALPPVAPVIAEWGGRRVLLCAAGNTVHAFEADGTPRFEATLTGNIQHDLALGDIDGNGADEVVALATSQNRIGVIDSSGASLPGWPYWLGAAPGSAPVIGPLGQGPNPDVMFMLLGQLFVVGDSAREITVLPKPGGAGFTPTLLQLDGDDATEVAAGTGPDSVLYVYDAGAGTWNGSTPPWPTVRGNFARSGSRVEAPLLTRADLAPPGTVTDLAGSRTPADEVTFTWTIPGDDGAAGTAQRSQIQIVTDSLAAGGFTSGRISEQGFGAGSGGGTTSVTRNDLSPDSTWYAVVRSFDEWGNVSALSNLAAVRAAAPPPGPQPLSLAARGEAGGITFWWTSPGYAGQFIEVFDVLGRRRGLLRLATTVAGTERWDARDGDGRRLRAGLYFARLVSGEDAVRARVVWMP